MSFCMISNEGTLVNKELTAFKFYRSFHGRFGGLIGCW